MTALEATHTTRAPGRATARTGLGPWLAGLWSVAYLDLAGLGFWRLVLVGELDETPGTDADWAAWLPELFWPLWGVALAVAGLAYAARRAGDR